MKLGPGRVSPKLAAILARIAIDVPFDPVPDIVAETLGLEVDGEMVRRVTEDLGSWAEAQEQQTIQDAQSEQAPVPPAPGRSTLLIAMDGAMVHTTRARDGHRGWHEAKVGVCARFEPTPIAAAPGVCPRVTGRIGGFFLSPNHADCGWSALDLGAECGLLTGGWEDLGGNSRFLSREPTPLDGGQGGVASRGGRPNHLGRDRPPSLAA